MIDSLKPITNEYISVHIASRLLGGLTPRRIEQMCRLGVFRTAHKPGYGTQAHWRILRAEVVAHRFNGHKREM